MNERVQIVKDKRRIQFIDLAKGICIILVVISHVHIEIPYLLYIRMPLYFILSGLFFKEYAGFFDFVIRKTNKILIPFLFFYLLGFLVYYLLSLVVPDVRINSVVEKFYIYDPICSRLCVNSPLWFLLSLYTVNIIFYLINKISSSAYVQGVVMVLVAICAYICKEERLFLPIYFEKSLFYMPFFFVGNLLKKQDVLIEADSSKKRLDLLVAIGLLVLFAISVLIDVTGPVATIRHYIASTTGVCSLLLFLKQVGDRKSIISYFGRYSIIILCTSFWIYNPLRFVLDKLNLDIQECYISWSIFVITMAVEYMVIKLFVKYLPYVTAQKDLIPVKK